MCQMCRLYKRLGSAGGCVLYNIQFTIYNIHVLLYQIRNSALPRNFLLKLVSLRSWCLTSARLNIRNTDQISLLVNLVKVSLFDGTWWTWLKDLSFTLWWNPSDGSVHAVAMFHLLLLLNCFWVDLQIFLAYIRDRVVSFLKMANNHTDKALPVRPIWIWTLVFWKRVSWFDHRPHLLICSQLTCVVRRTTSTQSWTQCVNDCSANSNVRTALSTA